MKNVTYSNFITISVLFLSVCLSGCIPAVIAGTAGVTYYVAKDERTVGTIVDDAAITTAIKTKLLEDELVSTVDIHVDTAKGCVTLAGNVPSHKAYIRALDIAKDTKGVRKVISKLTITPKN